jgi:phospholipid/cholesterol/gamma-HCH transport system substrate-binding protein
MLTKAQKVRLGVFLIVGLVLVGGGVALLAGLSLFRQHDYYQIQFRERVSGLSPGSPVKIRGVEVGRVESLRINPKNVELVEVEIRVRENTPILKGAEAQIVPSGITGLKHVEISGGQQGQPRLEPGSTIPSKPSALTKITGKAEAIAFKAERLINNVLEITRPKNRELVVGLLEDTRTTVQRIGKSAEAATALMVNAEPQVNRTLAELGRSARRVRRAARSLDHLMDTANREVKLTFAEARGALENMRRITGAEGDIQKSLKKLRKVADTFEAKVKGPEISRSLTSVRSSLKAMRLLMVDLRALVTRAAVDVKPVLRSARNAAEHLEEFARRVRENPAALLRPASTRRRKLPRR